MPRAGWISSLLPLKDKAYQLAPLGEVEVEKQPALGIKVTRKGYPEVKLYFSKKTGLLAKTEFRVKATDAGNKEVLQELYYHDHREVDGAQVPRKVILKRDGKLFVDSENHDMKAHGKLDNKVFAMP